MRNKILFLMLLGLAACNKTSAPALQRTFIDTATGVKLDSSKLANPFEGRELSACDELQSLKVNPKSVPQTFSIARELKLNPGASPELQAGIDIGDFPLVQIIIPQKLNFDESQFLHLAEEAYKSDQLSGVEWLAIEGAWTALESGVPGSLQFFHFLQAKGINGKAAENFPGIFGESNDADKSLIKLLLSKTYPGNNAKAAEEILTATSPLFSKEEGDEFGTSTRRILTAAIQGSARMTSSPEDQRERMCALVLWHRSFAQMLTLKGFQGVEMASTQDSVYKRQVQKLTASDVKFKVRDRVGGFSKNGQRVILEEKDIVDYAPSATGILEIPANLSDMTGSGDLSETLQMLEAMVYIFQATSPAAPWIAKESDYLLGDMTSTTSPAILPEDFHKLACGLMSILIKNLAGLHIQRVNAAGKPLKADEAAAGMLIVNRSHGAEVSISVRDLARFTRILVYLDSAILSLTQRDPAVLEKMNSMYDKKKLAMFLGTKVMSQKDLDAILSPDEQKNILVDQLTQMKMPVAFLLSRLRDRSRKDTLGCVKSLTWHLDTGKSQIGEACDKALDQEFAEAVTIFSAHTASSILQ